MARHPDWPELDWNCPALAKGWLVDRVFEMAARARQFELAFEQLAEEGTIDLGTVESELLEWDNAGAEVFVYTGLGEGRAVPSDATFADSLRATYDDLIAARRRILDKFGRAGSKIAQREGEVEVGRDALKPRPPPAAPQTLARFTGEMQAIVAPTDLKARPVSVEEVRNRTANEQKVLPESRSLGALLAILPSDWVAAVFTHLDLSIDDESELTAGSRSAARRGLIFRALLDPKVLQRLIYRMNEDERGILSELIAKGGLVPYKRVTELWGLDEADGFYWSERPPSGPVARLRRMGVIYVGTRFAVPTVALPGELTKPLQEMLAKALPSLGG